MGTTEFVVHSVRSYNAMRAMTTALPNLQQIKLNNRPRYVDGEDPDEHHAARTAHDIDSISNFRKLRILKLSCAQLNGRYPVLFTFPLLQKLTIQYCNFLKWDLEMLAGMPVLKELKCHYNSCLTGNISSLRVLKNTLEKVIISFCFYVEGNFMDLADFPHLKELNLNDTTAVRGDIRDIRDMILIFQSWNNSIFQRPSMVGGAMSFSAFLTGQILSELSTSSTNIARRNQ